jgi:hypothetical protein
MILKLHEAYISTFNFLLSQCVGRLCGLVVRVPGYRSKGPGSISGATRFSENGVHSAS